MTSISQNQSGFMKDCHILDLIKYRELVEEKAFIL